MKRFGTRTTWPLISAVVLISVGLGAYAAVAGTQAPAPSAPSQISALAGSSTQLTSIPAALSSVAPDVAPVAGSVHQLVVRSGYALYAWLNGGRVCHQDTNGVGGCFAAFNDPVTYMVADPDSLGSGQPLYVSGIAPDGVASVVVDTNAGNLIAPVSHNAFYKQLKDATLMPDAITSINAVHADGNVQTIDHHIAPLSQLKAGPAGSPSP